jgi:hypothetical protein
MDYKEPKVKRDKKSDKAKKTHDRNGGFSQKHVRQAEALLGQAAQRVAAKK